MCYTFYMTKKQIINKTSDYIQKRLSGEHTGHDWYHIYRVWRNAKRIGRQEKADMFVVEMGALLHDIADSKFHNGDDKIGPRLAKEWLTKMKVDEKDSQQIIEIINNSYFKGVGGKNKPRTIEGQIVQDADHLDALGAISIARVFATGADFKRPIYDPNIKPVIYKSRAQYKKRNGTSINHFYEKLLYIKNMMNTKTGKKIAIKRDKILRDYLKEFFREWNA